MGLLPVPMSKLGMCILNMQNNTEKNKLNKNAIIIQKTLRGHQARQFEKLTKLNKNAIIIQKILRGTQVRKSN